MYVVLRKFPEDKEWNIVGAFASETRANAQVAKEQKTGREAAMFPATCVWVAENSNNSWN